MGMEDYKDWWGMLLNLSEITSPEAGRRTVRIDKKIRSGFGVVNQDMIKMNFVNVIWKEEKFFVAQCLSLDVSSFGNTYEEALSNLNEAVELRLEDTKPGEVKEIEILKKYWSRMVLYLCPRFE